MFPYSILKIFRKERVSAFGFQCRNAGVTLVAQSDYAVLIKQSLSKEQNVCVYVNAL